jgi:predicted dehydrogenase
VNDTIGIGQIGYAFMGRAHSQAWHTVGRLLNPPLRPRPVVLCGRNLGQVTAAADRLGWEAAETDWRAVVARPDVDLVDICTPGDSHAEIAIAALEAGKHALCEKPLANSVAEAEAMTAAAERAAQAGIVATVGFNYRRVPAIALARQLVADGRVGAVRHVRATYLQDWIVDPEFPLVWRLQRDRAGSGALGDIGAHAIDLAQFVTGELLTDVSARTTTFISHRPLPGASDGLSATGDTGRTGEVTVDDAAIFTARLSGGGLGTFEATRFATGRKNALRLEVNGSRGSLAFDFEAMNELWFYDHTEPADTAGFRRILVTEPEHPYLAGWWPPGHGLGYEHTFAHQALDLLTGIAQRRPVRPTFADGLQVQRVLDAVERSAADDSRLTAVAQPDPVPAH